MSDTPNPNEPQRDIIAPRHESLALQFEGDLGPRPLEYGEARLWLVARDPRWLFAYWQFIPAEHPEAINELGDALFFLRILAKDDAVETETAIQPDNGNIYLPANLPESTYSAELGFYAKGRVWCFIARSSPAHTPPADIAPPAPIQRATIPANVPLQSPIPNLAPPTPEQEKRFAQLLALDVLNGGKPEGRAARARAKMHTGAKKQIPVSLLASLETATAPSSPAHWAAPESEFHLNLNAELIFYGGTAHDATLRIAGKPADLRHDGTFRIHCRLPDGEFEIPIIARSADGKHERKAVLRFCRETTTSDGVTAAEQPDYLPERPPGI